MSDITEGLGTAVEGGLFARAIEPGSGAKKRKPDDPANCLNCGNQLIGAYCHDCGQPGHIHRTMGAFMHDLLHGALHFEGKLWRTLPMLAFRPGRLTRRYIDGARARFVSPMALFLFSVFLMFAVLQVLGVTAPADIPVEDGLEEGLDVARSTAESEIAEIEQQLTDQDLSDEDRAQLQERLGILHALLQENPVSALDELTRGLNDGMQGDDIAEPAAEAALADKSQIEMFADTVDSEPVIRTDLSDLDLPESGIGFVDGLISKWRANPSLMLYKLQANSYKFSWLLIPISVPFIWLLFAWRRRFGPYDHAIFVTYSLSFMTLLFITIFLLEAAGVASIWLLTLFATVVPWHIYRQLRGAYEISRFSAVWRLLVIFAFILIILTLFLQVLLVLGTF